METKKYTVKFIAQWGKPSEIKEWFKKYCKNGDGNWGVISIVDTLEADFYVICNYPSNISQQEWDVIANNRDKVIYCTMEPSYFFNESYGFFHKVQKDAFRYVFDLNNGDYSPSGWASDMNYKQLLVADFSKQKITITGFNIWY
jgi:hypothetical protein